MQIVETESAGLKKTYRVTVGASEIGQATEAELKNLSGKVKIPGFRPGNVPLKIMQARYGKAVRDDVIRSVVTDSAEKAVRDHKLRPAATPDVKMEDYKEGGELVFTLGVETLPEIPELKFGDIALTRETFEITDAMVDESLVTLAENFQKPAPLPEGAKAESGHMLTIDFVGKTGGKPFDGGTAEGFNIAIGSGRLIPGFEEQLIGAKAGDAVEVKVDFPEEYFSKDLAGKPAVFDVTVREVAKLETPPVDDAFAAERGMKDLAALREAVKGRLTHEYGTIVRARLKKRLFDELEEQCGFDLPPSMVESEFEAIWGRLQQNKATDVDVYEGKSEEEVKAEYRHIAGRRVKLGLLLAEISRRQKIEATREELARAVSEQARQFRGQEQAIFDFYRKHPERLEELRGPILEEKAVDWLFSQVQMNDVPATPKELADSRLDDVAAPQKREKKATPAKKAPSAKKKPK